MCWVCVEVEWVLVCCWEKGDVDVGERIVEKKG